MEVFFHLFYNMFCLKIMLNLKVRRCFDHLMGMPADRTELPFLETIHIGKSSAGRAPDNKVHNKEVMRVILIKTYRLLIDSQGYLHRYIMLASKKMNYPIYPAGMRNETPLISDL